MECKWHEGEEADLTCMNCGQHFCRECVKETRESHYCPDCHRAELERFASQLGVREPAAKEKKPKRKARKEKLKEEPEEEETEAVIPEKKEKKTLRRPRERVVRKPPSEEKKKVPPPPDALTEEERAAFWEEEEPLEPVKRRKEKKPAPVMRVEGLPPPAAEIEEEVAGEEESPLLVPEKDKKRVAPKKDREKAVLTAEGFPTGGAGEEEATEEEAAESRRGRHTARRGRQAGAAAGMVAMQMPDEYDGELTASPSYLKAVLFGILAGALGAGAYAGIAFWRHNEYGIVGWLIGVAVGITVWYASGRHFNWKLGLIAAGIAFFFISAGRILLYMLTVWFPEIEIFNIPFIKNFNNALTQFWRQLPTVWLVYFFIAGGTAFLLTFRPWPIRFKSSRRAASREVARRRV